MQELGEWLGRVEAPAELRERVVGHGFTRKDTDRNERRRRSRSFVPGLAVAAAILLLLPGIYALRTWMNRPLHSNDPARVRAWVASRTGIRVPFPDTLGAAVRLEGARRADGGAQIAYSVNGQEAVMLVALASAAVGGDGKHRFLSRDAHSASWTMNGLVYTVSCPQGEVAQVSCQLCHSL